MPGEWIKPRQVVLYMKARKEGYKQNVAAAKASISERSGRNIEHKEPFLIMITEFSVIVLLFISRTIRVRFSTNLYIN